MITFSSIKNLLGTIQPIEIKSIGESGSITNCIKIEQIDKKLTRFTTYEPLVGLFSRDLIEVDPNCFGQEGDTFIVDYSAFIDILTKYYKTGAESLTINLERGMLALYSNYKIDSMTGKKVYRTKLYCNLYSGGNEDFKPPTFEESTKSLLGYVPSDSLNSLISVVTETGGYNDSNETYLATVNSSGRGVKFTCESDRLSVYAESKNKSVWYSLNKPASFTADNKSYILEGRNLHRLKTLVPEYQTSGEVVNMYSIMHINYLDEEGSEYSYDEWLLFETNQTRTYIRVVEVDIVLSNNQLLFNKFHTELTFNTRECSPFGLFNAFTAMHQKNREAYEYLLLIEIVDEDNLAPPKFAIKDVDNILLDSDSWIDIIYSDNKDFFPIAFRYEQVSTFLGILKKYYEVNKSIASVASPFIELKLGIFKKTLSNGNIHLFYVLFSNFSGSDEVIVHCQPTDPETLGAFASLINGESTDSEKEEMETAGAL